MAEFDLNQPVCDRDRLEMRLGALMDGTLSPAERAEVEALVAGDTSLQVLLADLQDVNATLGRLPSFGRIDFAGMTDVVMGVVRADLAGEVPAPLKLAPAAGWNAGRTIRWAGVAAALVVGLGSMAMLLKSEAPAGTAPADPTRLVDATPLGGGGESMLNVTGPSVPANLSTLPPAVANPLDALATADGTMTVTGPDAAAVKDPKVRSGNIPDYAATYANTPAAKTPEPGAAVTSVADRRGDSGE